ncbi:MBL fold metallo-hydrolase [Ruegeria sp. R13_0]|uniref:MBL fold metallo-hydrolase n=1 Tax=Ruegeria sp. R13_0 TaxID=2821099 RepID=UPI0021136C66|nr:MBL fold metallo-hydrolase [Ruegeria sp. R13_0]
MTNELKITRITRPGAGSVNSWLIEDTSGVVLIDAQRVLSVGREVAAAIQAIGKPLKAVLITHPHPDHFGGLSAVLEAFPGTPVYSSPETRKVIETDSNGLQTATRKAVPQDTPQAFPAPDHTFSDGETLLFGRIELVVSEIGPGESEAMSMFHAPGADALFTGDLVANDMTSFVLEGRSSAWIAQIDRVARAFQAASPRLYPGHGEAGSFTSLLSNQRQWLVDLREMTRARISDGELSDRDIDIIKEEFEARYQNRQIVAEIATLLALNIQAVAEELSKETGS